MEMALLDNQLPLVAVAVLALLRQACRRQKQVTAGIGVCTYSAWGLATGTGQNVTGTYCWTQVAVDRWRWRSNRFNDWHWRLQVAVVMVVHVWL
jgi:hypothetical protein